jgi:spore maturation protein SpmA
VTTLVCLIGAGAAAGDAPDSGLTGLQVMQRVNERPRPAASARRMLLVLQRAGGRRIDREIIAYQTDDGLHTKTLYSVVSPAEMLGLSILRWEAG